MFDKLKVALIRKWVKTSRTAGMVYQLTYGQPQWTPTNFSNYATAGYKGNVYAYRCVNLISTSFSGVPWYLVKKKTTRKGKDEEIETHPLLDLWNKPNPKIGGTKFRENTIAYLMIAGNSYIERIGPDNPNKPPLELYNMRPDRVSILPGDSENLVRAYRYSIYSGSSEYVDIPPEFVLHILLFDPLEDWYGCSPLKAASKSLDQNNISRAWNVAMLQNRAQPSGFLKTEKNLDDIQFEQLENRVIEKFTGSTNVGKPMLLEGGLAWEQAGLSPADMDWLEGLKLSAREIAIAYGVPPELIGDNTNKTYSNYKEARKALYEENVLPLLDWYKDEVNNWLTGLYAGNLEMRYDIDEIEVLQEERDKVWSRVQSSDWLTLDEKREATGYDELPDGMGKVLLVASNKVELSTLILGTDEEEQQATSDLDNEMNQESGDVDDQNTDMEKDGEEEEQVVQSGNEESKNPVPKRT